MRDNVTTATCGSFKRRIARIAVVLLPLLLALAGNLSAQVTNNPVDWVGGDVFAGSLKATGGATYQVWHSGNPNASKPSYTVEQTITDAASGTAAGCGFDLAYRFFGTNFTNTLVDRYSIANAHPLVEQVSSHSGLTLPQSVALDAGPNLFIGYAGGASGGSGKIEQWQKDVSTGEYTHFVGAFPVPVDNSGPGWIDLAPPSLAFPDGLIFYTSQGRIIRTLDPSTGNTAVWADLSTLNGNLSKGTLYAIRILGPSGNGNDGVLVADQVNVKLIKASGGVITSVTVFKFSSLSNLQALTLDLSTQATGPNTGTGQLSPTTFWVGDATATSNNLVRYNMSTGKTEATLSTGAGVGGVCVDGAFNAAQFAFQQPGGNNAPNFQTQTFPLTPANNTLQFTSPFTGETVTATLRNLKNNVTVTLRDSLVPFEVGMSDPTVYFLNPGAPTNPIPTIPGNWPCDHTLTDIAGYPHDSSTGLCEVLSFEANPNSGFSSPDMITDTGQVEDTLNLAVLSNAADNVTTGVVKYPTLSRNCVLTINQQPTTGGVNTPKYTICSFSPADNAVISKSAGNSTITFNLKVNLTGQCLNSGNQGVPDFLKPLLIIDQLQTDGSAPKNIDVLIAGSSGGPPVMTFSGNTYQLQVKTTDIPTGFTYLATVIDLTGNINIISSHFTFTK